MDFQKEAKIIVTCHKNLNLALEKEIRLLGFEPNAVFHTGVALRGTLNDCIKLNLHLRTASQVLYSILDFDAFHIDEIYSTLRNYAWEKVFEIEKKLCITSNVFHESINNSMFANLRIKDAIVDRLREKYDNRPNTSSDPDEVVIHMFWNDNKAQVYIDSTGHSLARHGYRKIPGTAPMLEALAAATIIDSLWDYKSVFANPMCGSGTLAIEAAMLASHTPPSVFRMNYAFMHLIGYDENIYYNEMESINDNIIEKPNVKIIASDISEKAIENAMKNAKAAGLSDWIEFQTCSFDETKLPQENKGIIFFNPEYGERLGDQRELENTYKEIGDFMKNKGAGYWGYVFTGNANLAKHIGLKPKRKMDFYNAKIPCKLLEFELYEGSKFQKEQL